MNPPTPLEDLLTWILVHLHDSVGFSWAWSIVALVVIVRMLLVPLTVRQIHSMQNLQAHAPEMKTIQQQYKGDRQKMNAEMMAFYKENQINPAASCLPILAQFPVFISLFFVLKDFEGDPAEHGASGARLAGPDQHHRGHEGRLGAAADRLLRPSQLTSSYLMSRDAAGAARPAADPADRVHPVHAQLPVRPDALLADDEPLDDGPGLDHPPPDAEAAAAAEEELAHAAEGGGRCGGSRDSLRSSSSRRGEASRPQGETEERRSRR